MNNEDRYHTTSWDASEVQRRAVPEGGGQGQETHNASGGRGTGKAKKKKKQKVNPLLAFGLWIAIVAASSIVFASVGWLLANDFAALNKTPFKEVNFEVLEEWASGTIKDDKGRERTVYDMGKVAKALKEKGLIEYSWFFRLFSWVYKAEKKITQGTYTLNTDMDYMALIGGMRSTGGSVVTVDVAIPEGYTVYQIIELLAEKGVGTVEDLTETAKNYVFEDYEFINNDNLGDISRLEGYLFPDTYNFYVGGRTELAFGSMLTNFRNKVYNNEDLTEQFAASEEAGYSLADIINIASLIEKETDGSDRDKIASVIYNRLQNEGETYYLLQIDAALVYAAGREITQADYTDLDSPYNLYKNTGLPPTPIANPGIASIRAALQPADTNYYYYVLGEDGKHIFSETLEQHHGVGG